MAGGWCLWVVLVGAAGACRAEVACWLTRIDDGDARHARFSAAGARYDERQDEGFTLFRRTAVAPEPFGATGDVCRIAINRSQVGQTMVGYGAAMTDSAAQVLLRLRQRNPSLYAFAMKRLFSPEDGAGFSLLRVPMGASDYVAATNYYTYCDAPSPDLSAFSITHDLDAVVPMLKEARSINPALRILATPWSAPAWMKTSGRLTGVSPAEKKAGATNRLKPECVPLYAEYFVRFVEAYRAAGVPVWGVTLQNEPQFDAARYPCMRLDEADQIALVRALGPKLAAKKLATQIFVHDHNWILHPDDRQVVGGDAKADPLASVAKIFSDAEVGRFVAGSAWHGYAGGVDDMRRVYAALRATYPDKQILFTELSGWGKRRGPWMDDIAWGMDRVWIGGPQSGCQSALQWNLVLNDNFGPTLRSDSEATAMAAIDAERCDSARFEREYYAMAHLSRAAQPGAIRVAAVLSEAAAGLDAVAFLRPDGQTGLVVFCRARANRTLRVSDGRAEFSCTLPGRSLATLIW